MQSKKLTKKKQENTHTQNTFLLGEFANDYETIATVGSFHDVSCLETCDDLTKVRGKKQQLEDSCGKINVRNYPSIPRIYYRI